MTMWRRWMIRGLLLAGWSYAGSAQGEVVSPVVIKGTSQFGAVDVFGDGNLSNVFVTDLVDGGGLIDVNNTPGNVLDDLHDNDFFSTNAWHAGDEAAGIVGGTDGDSDNFTPPPVDQQILEFAFELPYQLEKIHIWQQNQAGLFGPSPAPARGVDQFRVLISPSTTGTDFTQLGTFRLQPEEGLEPVPAQLINLTTLPAFGAARRVRFAIDTAHSGEILEFVGLSEVRFEGTALAIVGDFNRDGVYSAADIDLLYEKIRGASTDAEFDVDKNGQLDDQDAWAWVETIAKTWMGDATFDGRFDSGDFVEVFTKGEYEDGVPKNSGWSEGDWDGDQDFTSSDFVRAFQGGGYEMGLRAATQAVPEPSAFTIGLLALSGLGALCRRCRAIAVR